MLTSSTPALSAQVCGLLAMLSRQGGRLDVHGRTMHGFAERRLFITTGSASWIPGPLLELLEEDSWSLDVSVGELGASSMGVERVAAIPVEWQIPTVYKNPERPDSAAGRQHVTDDLRFDSILGALGAFPLPPSAVINRAGHAVHALFALDAPIQITTPTGADQVRTLRRQLAEALGADVPDEDEHLPALSIPLPGSRVREPPYLDYVTSVFDGSCTRYSVDQITTATKKRKKRA